MESAFRTSGAWRTSPAAVPGAMGGCHLTPVNTQDRFCRGCDPSPAASRRHRRRSAEPRLHGPRDRGAFALPSPTLLSPSPSGSVSAGGWHSASPLPALLFPAPGKANAPVTTSPRRCHRTRRGGSGCGTSGPSPGADPRHAAPCQHAAPPVCCLRVAWHRLCRRGTARHGAAQQVFSLRGALAPRCSVSCCRFPFPPRLRVGTGFPRYTPAHPGKPRRAPVRGSWLSLPHLTGFPCPRPKEKRRQPQPWHDPGTAARAAAWPPVPQYSCPRPGIAAHPGGIPELEGVTSVTPVSPVYPVCTSTPTGVLELEQPR